VAATTLAAITVPSWNCGTATTCVGLLINAPTGATTNYTIDTGLTATDLMRVGKTLTGAWVGVDGTYAFWQNASLAVSSANAGLAMNASGQMTVNSAAGQVLALRIGNTGVMSLNSTSDISLGSGDGGFTPVAFTLRGQTATGTNVAGQPLTFRGVLGTGTGVPGALLFSGGALGTAAGTTGHTSVTRHSIGSTKILTNNVPTTIASATLVSGSVHASQYSYAVVVNDGTDHQVEEGWVSCHVINKAGTITDTSCIAYGNQQAKTAGTLTVLFAISAANPAVISVNANSSLTPSTGYPRLTFEAINLTQQALALP
jgi:hypothetical protein